MNIKHTQFPQKINLKAHVLGFSFPKITKQRSQSNSLLLSLRFQIVQSKLGTAVAQCLRRCATNRKGAGSIPDGVTGIFH